MASVERPLQKIIYASQATDARLLNVRVPAGGGIRLGSTLVQPTILVCTFRTA